MTSAKIPDGGWGWMVVFSCLILSLIQDGVSFAFGILYTEFIDEFEASKASAAWIGSLLLAIPLLTGPIMSWLVDKYGCRSMTITGGLFSTLGFISSYFVKDILIMYFTFGIIAGAGLGLTYITSVVSLAFWFDKKRTLAMGLGACGTGIGTFIYAPFTTFLLNEYGWRWTVVLLGGTLLNICVCGALMRDPDWILQQNSSSKNSSTTHLSNSEKTDLENVKLITKEGHCSQYLLEDFGTTIQERPNTLNEHCNSEINLPTFLKLNETVPSEVLEQLRTDKKMFQFILENYPQLIKSKSTAGLDHSTPSTGIMVSMKLKKNGKELPTSNWLVKHFSSTYQTHTNYFKSVRFPRHSINGRRGTTVFTQNKYRLKASSCPNIYKISMTTLNKEQNQNWYSGLVRLMTIFDELHFFLLSVSTVILFAWFMTPYFYLVDHMVAVGYSMDEASYVLSGIGVANTIGMVVLGWAGDQTWCNVSKTFGICLIFCGICCSAIYHFTMNYTVLLVFGAFYGIFLASSFSFTPTVMMDMLPLETFTKAYGLQLLCQGIGHLGGPPLAALLADWTGTWSYSFHLSAIWIAVSGVLMLIIPYTKNRRIFGNEPVEKEMSIED